MNKRKAGTGIPIESRPLTRVSDLADSCGISRQAVMKIARELGAVHKISSRCVLIDTAMFFDGIRDCDAYGQQTDSAE